ncbi:hypothetical protein ACFL53_03005 [Pseudomonadota bacterium]
MPDLSFIHAPPFYELTALVVLAAAIGFCGVLLRQPMNVSFMEAYEALFRVHLVV